MANDIEEMLQDIEHLGEGLTSWEEDFIESIRDQFNRKQWLTPRQEEILERIHEERT